MASNYSLHWHTKWFPYRLWMAGVFFRLPHKEVSKYFLLLTSLIGKFRKN